MPPPWDWTSPGWIRWCSATATTTTPGASCAWRNWRPGRRSICSGGLRGDFYHGDRYIGIDKAILQLPNLHLLEGDCRLDEELFLFTGITGRTLR